MCESLGCLVKCVRGMLFCLTFEKVPQWKQNPVKKNLCLLSVFVYLAAACCLYEILACMFYEAFLERRFVTPELFPPYFLPNAFGGLSSASSKLLSMKKGSFFLHYQYQSWIFLNCILSRFLDNWTNWSPRVELNTIYKHFFKYSAGDLSAP